MQQAPNLGMSHQDSPSPSPRTSLKRDFDGSVPSPRKALPPFAHAPRTIPKDARFALFLSTSSELNGQTIVLKSVQHHFSGKGRLCKVAKFMKDSLSEHTCSIQTQDRWCHEHKDLGTKRSLPPADLEIEGYIVLCKNHATTCNNLLQQPPLTLVPCSERCPAPSPMMKQLHCVQSCPSEMSA